MGTALITGSSGGIGFALADVFAGEGHDVVMVADGADKLEKAADRLRALHGNVKVDTLAVDLADPAGAGRVYAAMRKGNRRIDFLVNNAGMGVYGDFARENDLAEEMKTIQLNAATPVQLAKLFVQDFLRQGSGRMLFTASVVAVAPSPNLLVYSATKAFVYHFAEGLRVELKDTPITVTALLPGATDTDFFKKAKMQDTLTAKGDLDDPADVARAGYDAMMAGDDHVVVHLNNKAQVVMAKLMPMAMNAEHGTVK